MTEPIAGPVLGSCTPTARPTRAKPYPKIAIQGRMMTKTRGKSLR